MSADIVSTADVEVPSSDGVTDEQWAKDTWDTDKDSREDAELDAWADEPDEPDEESEPMAKPRQASPKADEEKAEGKETKAPGKSPQKAKEKAEPEKEAEPEKPRSYRVKLDGEEREIPLDKMARALGTTIETLSKLEPGSAEKLYQKLHLAETRQRESTQAIQQFEGFIRGIKGNPIPALQALLSHKDIGIELKTLATDYLAGEFQDAQLPAAEREANRLKRELDRMKADQARQTREREEAENLERRHQWVKQLNGEITEALTAAKLPVSARMRSRIVSLMQREQQERAEDGGVSEPSKAKDLIPALRKEIQEDVLAFTQGMPAEELEGFFGEQIVKALGEARVARFKQRQSAQLRQPAEEVDVTTRASKAPKRRPTFKEVLDSM